MKKMRSLICFGILGCLSGMLYGLTLKENYWVDFFESMSDSKYFNVAFARQDPLWQLASKLYEQGMSHEFQMEGDPKIPMKFHLIWLGSSPPERYYLLEKKLRDLHPRFEIKLWTDHDVAQLSLINREAYNAAINWGEKSDIVRYEILYNEGGIYLDGDFDVFKSFEELCYATQFFAGLAYDPRMILYNGLIGSQAGHPILKLCIDEIGKIRPDNDPESIMERTGPYHFTRCFIKGVTQTVGTGSPGIAIPFPVGFFYPWPNYALYDGSKPNSWLQNYSFAMHLWARSWINDVLKT